MNTQSFGRRLLVNLVFWDNSGGLTADIHVLHTVLANLGCRVVFNGRSIMSPPGLAKRIYHGVKVRLRHGYASLRTSPAYDINLFVESIDPNFVPFGRLNCLLPNPEWFRKEHVQYLSQMDWVLCKTRDAIDIFKSLGCNTRYLGFMSRDQWNPEQPRTVELTCLHAAGASRWKGTSAVVQAWSRHPEWPRLIVIRRPFHYDRLPAEKLQEGPNIEYITDHLDDQTWKNYQNACGVHLCPSEAEGFGHIIVGGMSCGAVVITTDGPPMNELVTSDRGILVGSARTEPMCLGTAYFVDVDDLERQIGLVIEMTPERRRAIGQNARKWYEAQCAAFEERVRTFLSEVRFANFQTIQQGDGIEKARETMAPTVK